MVIIKTYKVKKVL